MATSGLSDFISARDKWTRRQSDHAPPRERRIKKKRLMSARRADYTVYGNKKDKETLVLLIKKKHLSSPYTSLSSVHSKNRETNAPPSSRVPLISFSSLKHFVYTES